MFSFDQPFFEHIQATKMEDGEGTHIDGLLNEWRQLAREERWWLYARASNPSQRQGWRRGRETVQEDSGQGGFKNLQNRSRRRQSVHFPSITEISADSRRRLRFLESALDSGRGSIKPLVRNRSWQYCE